jgi:hypothetical protein
MTSSSNNVVTENVVAFNGDATHNDNGVEVLKSGTANPVGNRILSSSTFSNQALGIDLNDTTGPSPGNPEGREQDPKDPDTGANNLQNFPVISSATSTGTTTTIAGTLNSKPRKTCTIQLFSNPLAPTRARRSWDRSRRRPTARAKPLSALWAGGRSGGCGNGHGDGRGRHLGVLRPGVGGPGLVR